ncbi:pentapeptide repeat-containing protein [Plantibacter sp. YIM 135347]|uniref:pentapeptide repeat-containing protein n=1 Tax=Plantibacter sp. YIM 135347 TaxID=3423919 RepID=UPI003D3533A8
MVKKPATIAPRLDTIRLQDLLEGDPDTLEAHERYEGYRFDDADLSHRDLAGTTFAECELVNVTAHETELRASGFVETVFDRLNAPIFPAPRSRFRDVVIDQSRLGSAELYEADWQSVHIRNSKLGYVNLRGAKLQDVLFTDCTIDELDLGGATANRVAFIGTEVNSLDLTRATLTHTDLRGLELRRLTGLEGLKGATITEYQVAELAPLFAAHFGVIVA